MKKLLLTILLDDTIGVIESQFARFREVGNALCPLLCTQIDDTSVIISLRDIAIQLDGTVEVIECPLIVLPLGIQTPSIII